MRLLALNILNDMQISVFAFFSTLHLRHDMPLKFGIFSGEVGVGDTVELTLQEVFDEVCPSEEEEGELWPDDGVEGWGGMDEDEFVKLGGTAKRKGNCSRDALSAPPTKKAHKSSKDQVTESI